MIIHRCRIVVEENAHCQLERAEREFEPSDTWASWSGGHLATSLHLVGWILRLQKMIIITVTT